MFNYLEVVNCNSKKEEFYKALNEIINDMFYNVSKVELIIVFPKKYSYKKSKKIIKIENSTIMKDLFNIGKKIDMKLFDTKISLENIEFSIGIFQKELKKSIIQDSFMYRDMIKELFNKYGFIETKNKCCNLLELFSYCFLIYITIALSYYYINKLNEEHYYEEDETIKEVNKENYNNWKELNKVFAFFDLIYPRYMNFKCIYEDNKSTNCVVFDNVFQMALSSIKEQIETNEESNMKECINCHRLFTPTRKNQLYCSREENKYCFLDRQNKRKNKSKSNKKSLL